jgi:hypothetical protein
MLTATRCLLRHGQYQTRLKTRMVGYTPKFVPRKMKGTMIALRSESNSSFFLPHLKSQAQRQELLGRKMQSVEFDPTLGRYCVFKESKIKGPFLLKSHIQKKLLPPK